MANILLTDFVSATLNSSLISSQHQDANMHVLQMYIPLVIRNVL